VIYNNSAVLLRHHVQMMMLSIGTLSRRSTTRLKRSPTFIKRCWKWIYIHPQPATTPSLESGRNGRQSRLVSSIFGQAKIKVCPYRLSTRYFPTFAWQSSSHLHRRQTLPLLITLPSICVPKWPTLSRMKDLAEMRLRGALNRSSKGIPFNTKSICNLNKRFMRRMPMFLFSSTAEPSLEPKTSSNQVMHICSYHVSIKLGSTRKRTWIPRYSLMAHL
jgi:hypothetical protein